MSQFEDKGLRNWPIVKLFKFMDDGMRTDVVWLKTSLAFKIGLGKVTDTS